MRSYEPSGWVIGAFAIVAAVCCAFPLVVAGALAVVAGFGVGGWLLIVVLVIAAVVGVGRHRRRATWGAADRDPTRDVAEV